MIPVPEELATVRRILEAHSTGESYAGIAAALNTAGIPTKRGRRWFASTVRNVVQRRDWYSAQGILNGRGRSGLQARSGVSTISPQPLPPQQRIGHMLPASQGFARADSLVGGCGTP